MQIIVRVHSNKSADGFSGSLVENFSSSPPGGTLIYWRNTVTWRQCAVSAVSTWSGRHWRSASGSADPKNQRRGSMNDKSFEFHWKKKKAIHQVGRECGECGNQGGHANSRTSWSIDTRCTRQRCQFSYQIHSTKWIIQKQFFFKKKISLEINLLIRAHR